MYSYNFKPIRVVDGDTVDVMIDLAVLKRKQHEVLDEKV